MVQEPAEELVDGRDRLEAADRLDDLERVVRALQLHVDDRVVAHVAQHAHELARFGDRREGVAVAVDDQRRRRVGPDVRHR